jgi:trehalose 6-phosphate phosphatase
MTILAAKPEIRELLQPGPIDVGSAALFLDLDGTLAAIEPRPDGVRADPRRTRLLEGLARALGGRLAVVSGRRLADIDRILDGAVGALAGVHGLERRRADGAVIASRPAEGLADARLMLEGALPDHPGLLVEDKGVAIAVHWREAPGCAADALAVASSVASRHGLELQPGQMVIELRPAGADKGDAVAAFMQEAPFKGFTPLFVGDDLTDENGFRAVEALGGSGVLVGPPRRTLASRRLAGVNEVLAWLEQAVA